MIFRLKRFKMMLFSIAGLAVLASMGVSVAQVGPPVGPPPPGAGGLNAFPGAQAGPNAVYGVVRSMPSDPAAAAWMKINSLKTEYASAKSDEERTKLKGSLQAVLVETFDLSMKQRKEQLDALSGRASKVQDKIDKRLAAKNDMISLQMKSYLIDGPDAFSASAVLPMIPGASQELNTRIREYQAAAAKENSEEMKKATEELRKALEQQFESDMENRRAELESIRLQVATLEKQSETRLVKKDEIISLRLQLAINEAQGLGLFADAPGTGFAYSPLPGVQMPHPLGGFGGQPQAGGGFGGGLGSGGGVGFGGAYANQPLPAMPGGSFAVPPGGTVTEIRNPGAQQGVQQWTRTAPANTMSQNPMAAFMRARVSPNPAGQLMLIVEPSEPAVLQIDKSTGKVAVKFSLRQYGLPDYQQIELDGENIVVHSRDGKIQMINTAEGGGWKYLSPDEIRKRSAQELERAKAEEGNRTTISVPEKR